MNYNDKKYWIEDTGLLTEAEKLKLARGLFELERQGVLEYRDGRWGLATGVELEETPDGPVARVREQNDAVPGELMTNSVTSSGEPSEARVPPLTKAARPSSEGSSSPDSDDEVNKQ